MTRNLVFALALLAGTAGPALAEGTHTINAWGARFEVPNAPVSGPAIGAPSSYDNLVPVARSVPRAYSSVNGNVSVAQPSASVSAPTRQINVWGAHFDVPAY
ncbi:hypothetical protein [Methylobacterium durans]|uniref:Porin n=1 Tax=Methylobacterium durans TaxID=2202825 RepID=A0A2U8W847_9HYPH|nr:hypothetical protein [Methylobacterium durans]AWN42297.1 hypothetical protein DK389_19625 [Methylobacterium durans]